MNYSKLSFLYPDKYHVDYHRSPIGHTGSATPHMEIHSEQETPKTASTDISSVRSDIATFGSAADDFPLLPPKIRNQILLELAQTDDKHAIARLLNAGANVNSCDQRLGWIGWTPLHYAVRGGHATIVNILLEHGAAVEDLTEHDITTNTSPRSPLDLAENLYSINDPNYGPIRQALLRYGATLRRTDKQLILAVIKGPVYAYASYSRRSLAASKQAPRKATFIFKDLVDAGANVNTRDEHGLTPLHHACRHKNRRWGLLAAQQLLALPDTSVNAIDELDKRTPLHWAAKVGNNKIVALLLRHGAQINLTDGLMGWSSLHFASFFGHFNVVSNLLKNGANTNVLDKEDRKPFFWAEQSGNRRVAEVLRSHASVYHLGDKKDARSDLHRASQANGK